jgi:arabinan endo-1,5-alpha-L-arabinosidase
VIDPSVVRDGTTGQLYLFWAEQHSSIWVSQLSPDGLTMSPNIHKVMWTQPGWECRTPRGTCVVEGPEEYYHDGWFYLFYSGASTWTGSYAIGVAASQDPLVSQFQRLDSQPALRSGNGYVGPGGSSAPVLGPDGRTYIFYHALSQPDPDHASAARYLFSSPIRWAGLGGYDPVIGSGRVDLRTAHRLAPPAPVRAQSGGRHRTARASGDRQRSESSHSTMRAPISAPASS